MTEGRRFLSEWLAPVSLAWWYLPLVVTLLVILALVLALAYWPGRVRGALTERERRGVRGAAWQRLAPGLTVAGLALLLWGAAAALCLGPRKPRVVVLHAGNMPEEARFWDDHIPAEHARWDRLDAGPLVQAVLKRAVAEGASRWQTAEVSQRQRLREFCLDVLLDREPVPPAPPSAAAEEKLPAWVRESVELTLAQGVLLRHSVPWLGVRCDQASPVWERAQRLLGAGRTTVAIFGRAPVDGVRVRSLFDGGMKTSGQVRFQALFEGKPGTNADLAFLIFAAGKDNPIGRLRQSVQVTQGRMVATITGTVAVAPGPVRMTARSEDGTAWTPLMWEDRPEGTVPVRGAQAARLVEGLKLTLATNGFAGRLRSMGWPALRLEVREPATGEPSVVVRDDAIVVLAAGLNGDAIPAVEPATLPVLDPPSSAWRVSQIGSAVPTEMSWMSVGLRKAETATVSDPVNNEKVQAGGAFPNQPLRAGRILDADRPVVMFRVMEQGRERTTGRPYVRFHLRPGEQGLLADPGVVPPEWEPARSQAFTASLAWAIEQVSREESHPSQDDGPASSILLTASDQDACVEAGRRTTDALAVTAVGACLLALLWQAWRTMRLAPAAS